MRKRPRLSFTATVKPSVHHPHPPSCLSMCNLPHASTRTLMPLREADCTRSVFTTLLALETNPPRGCAERTDSSRGCPQQLGCQPVYSRPASWQVSYLISPLHAVNDGLLSGSGPRPAVFHPQNNPSLRSLNQVTCALFPYMCLHLGTQNAFVFLIARVWSNYLMHIRAPRRDLSPLALPV